jgi:hypothetical protein
MALHDTARSRFWRKRFAWMVAIALVACILGMLHCRPGEFPEVVAKFSDGTSFTFVAITEPTPTPIPHHVPPVRKTWWQKGYLELWRISPPLMQRKLPVPQTLSDELFLFYDEAIASQRVWFELSGPRMEYGNWLVSGPPLLSRGSGYKSASSGHARWFFVNLNALPPSDEEFITVDIWSLVHDERTALVIKNPAYRPTAK